MSDSIAAFHSLRRITYPGKSSVSAYLSEVWPTGYGSTSALGRSILRLHLIHALRASSSNTSARTLPTATGRVPRAVFSSHITASWRLSKQPFHQKPPNSMIRTTISEFHSPRKVVEQVSTSKKLVERVVNMSAEMSYRCKSCVYCVLDVMFHSIKLVLGDTSQIRR